MRRLLSQRSQTCVCQDRHSNSCHRNAQVHSCPWFLEHTPSNSYKSFNVWWAYSCRLYKPISLHLTELEAWLTSNQLWVHVSLPSQLADNMLITPGCLCFHSTSTASSFWSYLRRVPWRSGCTHMTRLLLGVFLRTWRIQKS